MESLTVVLRAAGLPALGPDELDVPATWPDQNGARNTRQGLSYYLRDHPAGFVQVYEPREDTLDGPLSLLTHSLDVIAPTREAAETLARAARVALCGAPWREPGRCEFVSQSHERLDGPAHRLTLTLTEVHLWH